MAYVAQSPANSACVWKDVNTSGLSTSQYGFFCEQFFDCGTLEVTGVVFVRVVVAAS